MKILTPDDLAGIFTGLNYDVCCIIYEYYRPEYEIGNRCIKTFKRIEHYSSIKREQLVSINSIQFCRKTHRYFYQYCYDPRFQGFCQEEELRLLTKEEEGKPAHMLPRDIEALFWWR